RSAELVERVDQLLVQQGTPEERLELYESALRNESDPAQRVPLLRSIAELRQRELRDYAGAITAWRAVLSENPNDRAATLALVDALSEDGEIEIAYAELEQLLGQTEGEGRGPILAKLGEIATRAGALPQALSHYKELLTG